MHQKNEEFAILVALLKNLLQFLPKDEAKKIAELESRLERESARGAKFEELISIIKRVDS